MDTLSRALIGIFANLKHASIARCMVAIMLVFVAYPATSANAETRKLKLYYLHTGEKAEITFKKNGRYVKSGLKKINRFLRDWRKNEPTKMNPKLLDLIWEVYKETRSRKHIHVISGYRSPATNNLLRKRGRGVAKKSQHTLGNALDFFIPGVSLKKLRNIGLKKGIGGVGYYPKSGSPFVHMDTGRVRHWPRMNRRELVRVFPKGKTLHVPTDGKPLPGYNVAKANYERKIKGRGNFSIASAEEIKKKPSILRKLFSRDEDEEGVAAATTAPKRVKPKVVKPQTKPEETPIQADAPVTAPVTTPEAVPETPETVIASLTPSQIPVPILAPRIAVVQPPKPEIIDPEQPIAEEVSGTEIASLEPASEETPQDDNSQIAAVAIPVRAQRPEGDSLLLANAEPSPAPRPKVEVAALSAIEITDLRKQVYETLETPTQAEQAPVNVPFAPATQVAEADIVRTVTNENIPFQPPTQLEKSDVPSLIQSASSAINQIAAIEPIEPGTKQTGKLGIPSSKSQATSVLVTALLPEEPTLKVETIEAAPAVISNIPVPQKAKRPTLTASAKKSVGKVEPKPVVADNTTKEDNPLSETEFKTANLDERLTGKWAIATDASIKDIAEIRPPAYSKNILRASPSNVLSRGFTQDSLGTTTNSFSGSSLEFLDFKKFQ